jgi:O-antigen/teichoic acid export membrane protein
LKSFSTVRFSVLYDGLYTFVLRILNIGCAAGLGILTARLLGPAGKGLYALPGIEAGLIVSAFSGLGSALSYYLLNREPDRSVMRASLICAAAFVAAGAIAIVPIAFLSGERWAALPAIVSLVPASATNLAAGYALGIKRVRYSTSIGVAVTVFTLLLMAAGLFLIGRTPSVAIAMWLLANIAIGAAAIGAMLWHARALQGGNGVGTGEYAKFAVKVGLVNLVSLLNYRADLYIVAILASAASLGIYTVAVSAAESLLVPTQVAALVASPHIGSLDTRAAAALTARCVRNNLLIALVVCGAIYALAPPLVHLLYGAAFAGVVPVLRILLAGVLAMSLGSPMASYFTLKLGKPEVPLWLAGVSAAVCIAVSLALVPSVGIAGAAIGSTCAYIAGQAAAIWYFHRVARVGLRTILVPTAGDFILYRSFAARVLADSRQLLRPSTSTR